MKGDASQLHKTARIPNAVFFNLDACVGDGGPHSLPHMLPPAETFSKHASALGLSHTDPIVIYENGDKLFSAARIWYTFRV
jgi:thiosulfate/3-mercaptopyruvate sulfurtransferase